MKKLSLLALLFTLLSVSFLSCKKDSTSSTTTTSDYYIKGKKDGTAFNFTSNTQAKVMTGSGFTLFNLIAGANTSEGFNIGISSTNGSTIQTGIYREDYSGTNYTLGGVYNPNSTTIVYAAGIQTPSANPLVLLLQVKPVLKFQELFQEPFTGKML